MIKVLLLEKQEDNFNCLYTSDELLTLYLHTFNPEHDPVFSLCLGNTPGSRDTCHAARVTRAADNVTSQPRARCRDLRAAN